MIMNLHELTARTIRENPDVADPGVMAEEVFSRIGPEDYAAVIKVMIRDYTRQVMNERRVPPPAVPVLPSGGTKKQNRSAFVAAMQAGAWKERLSDTYRTAGGWKFLREMTAEDLAYAAAERRDLAASNLAVADRLEGLGKLLAEHGAETVGSLADDVLEPVLT